MIDATMLFHPPMLPSVSVGDLVRSPKRDPPLSRIGSDPPAMEPKL